MADTGAGEKLRVFLSYSRKDSAAFADELVAGLEVAGFAPFLDRHDIAAGEDWKARLNGLIAQSDTVVFIVSPEAVNSEICVWEVERTLGEGARRRAGRWVGRSRAMPGSRRFIVEGSSRAYPSIH
jgi:hypothetical protein